MTSQVAGKRRAKSAVTRTCSSMSRDSASSCDPWETQKFDDDVTDGRRRKRGCPLQSKETASVSKLINGKM